MRRCGDGDPRGTRENGRRGTAAPAGRCAGRPDYEVTYPNGDRTAYVTAVYETEIVSGVPAVADGEPSDVAWFSPAELTVRVGFPYLLSLMKAQLRV